VEPERDATAPPHRLTGVEVGSVLLQVADLARSLAFYEGVLGLHVLDRAGAEARLGTVAGRPLVGLRERRGARPVPPEGRNGLYHFAILLPERKCLGRFLSHLAGLGTPVGLADHLVSEASYLRDPDGLGIEVYADRPRESWVYRDGEVLLTTDPLDTDALEEAAGSSSWGGIPDGTVMGHMHLHVGDLTVAERFYHSALGLDKTMWSYPGALFLSADGYHHHLGLNRWGAPKNATAEDARLLEWTLGLRGTEQIELVANALDRAGHPVSRMEAAWTVDDPWGTTLRVHGAP
jgi:catechol 2,3-dioxygenase